MAPRSPNSSTGSSWLIAVAASRIRLNDPIKLMPMTLEKMSSECAEAYWPSLPMVRPGQPTPAQLMRTRTGPSSLAASTAAIPSASLVTSVCTKAPPSSLARASPFSSWTSAMTTLAPCAASRRAVAAPRPEAPPVTIADTPLISMSRTITDRLVGSWRAHRLCIRDR
ncbi:Uncharacterised protein [Mycobacteroides abscessus subsp. abscessus]|nr:Uncharacterised protein [Mycobacteroides abscessus subsp. abscessus]